MEVNVSVLTIGDELLNGELSDTNTAAIARRLAAHGYRVRESLCVRDEMDDIVAALQLMADRRAVLIVTGGLGPTADDLTAEAAATAFARPLEENPAAQEEIRTYFLRHNLTMHPRNDKQARLPVGVEILTNRLGTAPGFRLDTGHCDCFFLPGVPTEMVAMLDEAVLPRLERNHGEGLPTRERVLKVFGLSEPKCEALLVAAGLPEKVQVAFGVDFPFVHVKLRASGTEAETLLDRAEPVARRALGDFVVATGDASLAQTVARLLTEQGKTLALAEEFGAIEGAEIGKEGRGGVVECSSLPGAEDEYGEGQVEAEGFPTDLAFAKDVMQQPGEQQQREYAFDGQAVPLQRTRKISQPVAGAGAGQAHDGIDGKGRVGGTPPERKPEHRPSKGDRAHDGSGMNFQSHA